MNPATKERWRDAIGGTVAFGLFWSIVAGLHQPVWSWFRSCAEQTGAWAQSLGVPPTLAFLHAKAVAFVDDPVISLGCMLLVTGAGVAFAVHCECRRIDQQLEEGAVARTYDDLVRPGRRQPEVSFLNRQVLCAGILAALLFWAWPRTAGCPARRPGIIICTFRANGLPACSGHFAPETNETQRVMNESGLSKTNVIPGEP